MPGVRAASWVRERGIVVGGIVVGGLVAFVSTAGAWGGRPPAGEDVMAHLVRLDFGVAELVNHGRLDGWFPRFYLGYQEFLFNGPGLTWAAALVRAPTLGALSNSGALKVVGIVSLVALPASVAFAARSLGLGRRAAACAAVLALLVSNVFGVGLQGLYVVGLVPHQLAAPLFFVALGALVRLLVDRRARWIVVAGAALAGLLVTHLISVMILAVVFPLCGLAVVRRRPSWGSLRRLAAAALVAGGLAAWWLLPFLAHRDLRGRIATWETPPFGERVGDIVDGQILLRPYTILLVLAGWAYGLYRVRRHRPFALALVLVPPAYLLVAHWAASEYPRNAVAVQLANRGLGYVGILAVLPLAAALAGVARVVARRAPFLGPRRAAVLDGALLLLAAGLVLSALGPDRDAAGEIAEPVPAMRAAADQLARRVPDGARFATAREYPEEITSTGVLHPDTWLARESGRDSLNGFNLESSSTPEPALAADRVRTQAPEHVAATLGRLGVSHVVTTSDRLAQVFARSARFQRVWRAPPITIFALGPAAGQPAPASLLAAEDPVSGELLRVEPERLRIEVTADAATSATVAVAWSPKWRGRLDGDPVHLARSDDGLIEARIPAGTSTLELRYGPDGWDRAGIALTLLTVAGVVAWAIARARRRRGRQSASSSFSRIA